MEGDGAAAAVALDEAVEAGAGGVGGWDTGLMGSWFGGEEGGGGEVVDPDGAAGGISGGAPGADEEAAVVGPVEWAGVVGGGGGDDVEEADGWGEVTLWFMKEPCFALSGAGSLVDGEAVGGWAWDAADGGLAEDIEKLDRELR